MTGPKITFIGAGSTVFAKNPVGDILSYPEPAECRITLHDLDAHWLSTSRKVAERIARTLGRGGAGREHHRPGAPSTVPITRST